jgi:hypothetical protein
MAGTGSLPLISIEKKRKTCEDDREATAKKVRGSASRQKLFPCSETQD